MRLAPLIAVLLALAVGLAGCAKKPAPTSLAFSASGGKVSDGWARDGVGLVPGASLSGTLSDVDNKGNVNVSFDLGGAHYVVAFDQFAEAKPFQNGGVRFGFDEHGDSGNGDAMLPKVHAKAAAWGTAGVLKDGEVLKTSAGATAWTAHLMLLDDSPRGSDDKISNAAGTAPYDPAKPTDARVAKGHPQAIFYFQDPAGANASRPPANDSKTIAIQGPNQTGSVDIPTAKGASSLVVNVTIGSTAPSAPQPVAFGTATITLRDADGNATKTQTIQPITPSAPGTAHFELTAADIKGPFKLVVEGSGAFTAKVDYVIAFADHPFVVVTWDGVTYS